MSEPVPGKQYTVVSGDTLSGISLRAYGVATYWPRIFKANQTALKSSDPDLIFPGEIIFIPEISEIKKLKKELAEAKVTGKDADELTLVIDGLEIPVESGQVVRTIDTCADGWTATIAWTPGADTELDKRVQPFKYQKASVYLGGELMVSGYLYGVEPSITNQGIKKSLEGWSFTADLIDSTMKPPYEANNITLLQRAKNLIEPLGISVVVDDGVDTGGKFGRVTAEAAETIFNHLKLLASQRGVLISSTVQGDLLFTRAKDKAAPIGTIEEGQGFATEYVVNFDGRARFNSYRVLSDTPLKSSNVSIAKDDNVPRSRFITMRANENNQGGIKGTAEWQRSKTIADALTFDLPVSSWYGPDGKKWRENTIVTVKAASLGLPDGYGMLIKKVTYDYTIGGAAAVLSLVPPAAYTGEKLDDPWA